MSDTLTLQASTAADMMASNPVSLCANATVSDALNLFTQKGITAAPIIDEAGHPIGVLSRSDLFIHQQEVGRQSASTAGPGSTSTDATVTSPT